MPNTNYDAPYLDEAEHAVLDHAGIPGITSGGAKLSAGYYGSPLSVLGTVVISGWTQDAVSGLGLVLNDDGERFDLAPGDYIVNLDAVLAGGSDNTIARLVISGDRDGNYADAGPATQHRVPSASGQWQIHGSGWFSMASPGSVFVMIDIFGGVVSDTITSAGVDFLRVA